MQSFSLYVHHLSKRFGSIKVFDDVSFTHSEGVLGIAGSNGSGKSTLLQCLSGLKRPTGGTIEWKKEEELIEAHSLQNDIGYAAPYINLYAELSCAENLEFLLKLRGVKDRNKAVKDALDLTGTESLASQAFGKLSTGQQQRLRLASALIHNPDILFLDEPGSNLDEAGRDLIESLVSDFKKEGKLIFIASNIPGELALCDGVYSVEEERVL